MSVLKRPTKLKIVFVGDSGVGKTTLLNRYFYQTVCPNRVNVDLYKRELKIHKDNRQEQTVQIQVWDTVGQERYESLQSTFFRNADACVLVYDITRPYTQDNLVRWRDQFLKYVEHDQSIPIVVLANNCDLSQASLLQLYHNRTNRMMADVTCFGTNVEDGGHLEQVFYDIAALALKKKLGNLDRMRMRSKVDMILPDECRTTKCTCA